MTDESREQLTLMARENIRLRSLLSEAQFYVALVVQHYETHGSPHEAGIQLAEEISKHELPKHLRVNP